MDKTTCKIGLSFRKLANVVDRRNSSSMANSILFDQQSKGKKGTIVAMIAGTKAQTVVAIIEKTQTTKYSSNNASLAANMGLIATGRSAIDQGKMKL
jgi:hypothetical protein